MVNTKLMLQAQLRLTIKATHRHIILASLPLKGREAMASLDIEKKSLEAHVEICAVRYSNLETQLQNLETRMDKVEGYLIEIKEAIAKATRPTESRSNEEVTGPYKMMLTIGTTIGGALIGALITLIVHIK